MKKEKEREGKQKEGTNGREGKGKVEEKIEISGIGRKGREKK